jgi:hypothetical protein
MRCVVVCFLGLAMPLAILSAEISLQTGLTAIASAAPPTAATDGKLLDARLAKYARLAEVFEAAEPARVKGKRWVVVDVGASGSKETVEGWLMSEQGDSIAVLDGRGALQELQMPHSAVAHDAKHDASSTASQRIARHVREGDFIAACMRMEKEEDAAGKYGGAYSASPWTLVSFARYAYWARQIGDKPFALDLYARTDDAPDAIEKKDPAAAVANALVFEIRNRAISAARDDSRAESLHKWQFIASLHFRRSSCWGRTHGEIIRRG